METLSNLRNIIKQVMRKKLDRPSLKEFISENKEAIKKAHQKGESGLRTVRAYSRFVDKVIQDIYSVSTRRFAKKYPGIKNSKCVLIAVGGYGREELNPLSDIDILFLYEPSLDKYIDILTKDVITLLWDTGFKVGHGCRTIRESIHIGSQDLAAQTAMIESRYLVGDRELYEKFEKALKKDIIDKGIDLYIERKIEERKKKHSMYDESVNLLEPDIKESPGGLRDFHLCMWAAATKYGVKKLKGLYDAKLISKKEMKSVEKSYDFMLRVRSELHFLIDRKSDVLMMDMQKKIAYNIGYRDGDNRKLVELFMQDYYLNASNIYRFSTLFLDRCLQKKKMSFSIKKSIDDFFIVKGREIELRKDGHHLLHENPLLLLKIFFHVQNMQLEINSKTRDIVMSHLFLIDEEFRRSEQAKEVFLSILKRKRAGRTLRIMSELGVLGQYIPEFDAIRCLVQYDSYHKYTVDEHTLKSIEILEELAEAKDKEHEKLAGLYRTVSHPEIIKLALLFHDIGKGGGHGHVRRGGVIADTIMKRMGLEQEWIARIKILIDNHLMMTHISQRRDMHDEKIIRDFVDVIREEENLKMLYLLTYTDTRSVGPDVWTGWKAALLSELYDRTVDYMKVGAGVKGEMLFNKLEEEIFEKAGSRLERRIIRNYLELMPNRYSSTISAEKIINHIELMQRLDHQKLVLNYRHQIDAGYTELAVCTYGRRGLFSMIAGTLASKNINILGAQIFTSSNNIAVDTLQVEDTSKRPIWNKSLWAEFEKDLLSVIEGEKEVSELISSRKRYILPHKIRGPRIETKVRINNEISDTHTVIEVITEDRIGLLYDVTDVLFKLDLDISIAKIATEANKVIDVFYVTDSKWKKIFYWKKLREIESGLREKLARPK